MVGRSVVVRRDDGSLTGVSVTAQGDPEPDERDAEDDLAGLSGGAPSTAAAVTRITGARGNDRSR